MTIFQSIAEPVFVVDMEMRVMEVNGAFEQFFGISGQEIKGKKCSEVVCSHLCTTCPFEKALLKSASFSNIEIVLTVKGKEKTVLIGGSFLDDISGKYTGEIAILQDITERKQAVRGKKQIEEPKPKLIKGTGTILVVEDEEVVMDVTRAMLERLGYHIFEAKTGKEAIDISRTFDGAIDLVLLDIVLPDMEGKAIYSHIMKALPNLKVVVCSGYSIDGPAQEILDAGAQSFIQKPYSITALSEKLKDVFEGK